MEPDDPEAYDGPGVDRGMLILQGLRGAAAWSWRFLLVAGALFAIFYLIGKVWVGVLPLLLALLVSTVLWPVVRWLKAHRAPPALAAGLVLVFSVLGMLGILAAIAPTVVDQGGLIVHQAADGLQLLTDRLADPPFNVQNDQVTAYVDKATAWLQDQATRIAAGVLTGVSTVGSILVTFALTVVLTFFFLKDGERFSPWMRRFVGPIAGMHLTEASARVWRTLGGFIKAQALVSLVDAVFIGLGLWWLNIPMAFVLALITFIAGFIPIVGAVTAGSLAILVALVSLGWNTALWVLVLVLVVQQLEGNVLSPAIQGRSMELHPAIVILVVVAGGARWGIVGAFLAVPMAAAVVTVIRYGSEHLDLRTGRIRATDLAQRTPEGRAAAELAEKIAPVFQLRARQAFEQAEGERGAARDVVTSDDDRSERAGAFRDRFLIPLLRRAEGRDAPVSNRHAEDAEGAADHDVGAADLAATEPDDNPPGTLPRRP